ncbi:hypothetical protein ACIA49_28400 [Kribbella sp. NPDC051587]|uniref:hypothetical protein n=1 Tax=Kribbella sp. NPDC051587 TaxID=3364119 RepID=UPI00378B3FB2
MRNCHSCGAANRVSATYCGTCGTSLPAVEPDPATMPSSDATRYLCAAVQLDSRLAQQVVRDVLDERYKAPPTSPDVDLVPVVLHALEAQKRHFARDVLLTLLFFVGVWSLYTARPLIFVLATALCWVVVVGETLVATYGVVARDLHPARFKPDALPPPYNDGQRRRLALIAEAQRGNVSVYSAYKPFAGSGKLVDAWSMVLDTHRAAEGREVETFTVLEVHDFVRDQLRDLRTGAVTMTDRVFVDGRDIRDDLRFLPQQVGAPVTSVDPALLRSLTMESEDRARPYLCITVSGWQGQLVHSTFLRFVLTPRDLFIEASHFLLTPVRDEFQEVDRLLPEPTVGQALRIGGRALWRTPGHLFRAPVTTIAHLFGSMAEEQQRSRQKKEILNALRFDHGAPVSPRETVSDRWYQRYFQQLDDNWYTKVIDKRLLQSFNEFLVSKGIHTDELAQAGTVIQNSGVMITGGSVTTNSMAAGTGARAASMIGKVAKAAKHSVDEVAGRN